MTTAPRPLRTLEGPGAATRAARLRRRFRQASGSSPPRSSDLRRAGRVLLLLYWIICLAVIGWGLDRLYPQARAVATSVVVAAQPALDPDAVPARRVDRPFANCATAHAAGVYDIPRSSPAYLERQDGDLDGLACEPAPW